jgi:hypothetical protein
MGLRNDLERAESNHPPQLAFRYRQKECETWDDQNNDRETKTVLGFVETGLNVHDGDDDDDDSVMKYAHTRPQYIFVYTLRSKI